MLSAPHLNLSSEGRWVENHCSPCATRQRDRNIYNIIQLLLRINYNTLDVSLLASVISHLYYWVDGLCVALASRPALCRRLPLAFPASPRPSDRVNLPLLSLAAVSHHLGTTEENEYFYSCTILIVPLTSQNTYFCFWIESAFQKQYLLQFYELCAVPTTRD